MTDYILEVYDKLNSIHLVRHTSKLNYRIIINTIQFDSICRYLLLYIFLSVDHLQKAQDQHIQELLLRSS
jgi:hypothetical protein